MGCTSPIGMVYNEVFRVHFLFPRIKWVQEVVALDTAPRFFLNHPENILRRRPDALAIIKGSPRYPEIHGTVSLYRAGGGVLLAAQIRGLPSGFGPCAPNIFGFHIHEGYSCTGNAEDSFANAGAHYNPEGCPHPAHAGDLPPLFGNQGYAFLAFFTNRFTIEDVAGRAVIIHGSPDDFTTQPSGNSGEKIACGRILPVMRNRG